MQNIVIGVIAVVLLIGGVWWVSTSGVFKSDAPSLISSSDDAVQETGGTVAIVNGEVITNEDFNAQRSVIASQQGFDPATLEAEEQGAFKEQVIDILISRALLQQAAVKADFEVADTAVDEQYTSISSQFPTEEEFNQALSSQNMTKEELRSQIRTDLVTQAYLDQTLNLQAVTVSEEEVSTTYDQIATGEGVPPLDTVYTQVEGLVLQQKQQEIINAHVVELKANASIEVLI